MLDSGGDQVFSLAALDNLNALRASGGGLMGHLDIAWLRIDPCAEAQFVGSGSIRPAIGNGAPGTFVTKTRPSSSGNRCYISGVHLRHPAGLSFSSPHRQPTGITIRGV